MIDIKSLTREDLEKILFKEGFPKFSPIQVFTWIYRKRVEDFSKMTDLSKKLRKYLSENFYFSRLELKERKISLDTTEKFLFKLKDNSLIETVLIPEGKRNTLCISTQVGCKYKCKFCVSGLRGFKRNLEAPEIINQFLEVEDLISPEKITNIVFMGIGEPLDNFENLIRAIKIFMDNKGIYLGKRKICISTVGITPKIKKLIELSLGVKLSLSLHSAISEKRTKIIPVDKKYPLSEVLTALGEFVKKEKFPVTFEYILIKGFNSSREDAQELVNLSKKIKCKINLIPYNPSPYFDWQPPSEQEVGDFKKILKKEGVFFTLRRPRGKDIEAACGQLRARFL
ncbi:MAG: 23S rRNA (adenine(2503)-C(2))-methyltransferase RlmN [Candidatus Omnitrophica bacterium]|nr:23S rRNA (adenine(2503)-C(2))-methyltransferase RlmN [Candidatus Omnitrophota bacterium]